MRSLKSLRKMSSSDIINKTKEIINNNPNDMIVGEIIRKFYESINEK